MSRAAGKDGQDAKKATKAGKRKQLTLKNSFQSEKRANRRCAPGNDYATQSSGE